MCVCVCVCARARGERGAARCRPEDCAPALSTDAAAERVIAMAEGSDGMNVSAGPGKSHPRNFVDVTARTAP